MVVSMGEEQAADIPSYAEELRVSQQVGGASSAPSFTEAPDYGHGFLDQVSVAPAQTFTDLLEALRRAHMKELSDLRAKMQPAPCGSSLHDPAGSAADLAGDSHHRESGADTPGRDLDDKASSFFSGRRGVHSRVENDEYIKRTSTMSDQFRALDTERSRSSRRRDRKAVRKNAADERAPKVLLALRVADRLEGLIEHAGSDRGFNVSLQQRVLQWVDWWLCLEEPDRTGCFAKFVNGPQFELLSTIVILLNAVFMVHSMNYGIQHIGGQNTTFIRVAENVFLAFFCIELLCRVFVHRVYFFCNEDYRWNVFDLVLVLSALYEEFASALESDTVGASNVTFMRTMRVIKMVKSVRVLRLLQFLSEPRRMVRSLLGSIMSLFWSFFMMVFIFYLFSLGLVQGLTSWLETEDVAASLAEDIITNFGSVQQSMLTCYIAVTGGQDWVTYYSTLQQTGTFNSIFWLSFIMFANIALMNVLTGMFVENALKLAQPEYHDLALEKRQQDMLEAIRLRDLLAQLDEDKSGSISLQEFEAKLNSDKVRSHLDVMGLEVKDAHSFFKMLSSLSESDEVDIDFFVDSCLKMKGPASSVDLQTLTFEIRMMHRRMRRLDKIGRVLEQQMGTRGFPQSRLPAVAGSADASLRRYTPLAPSLAKEPSAVHETADIGVALGCTVENSRGQCSL